MRDLDLGTLFMCVAARTCAAVNLYGSTKPKPPTPAALGEHTGTDMKVVDFRKVKKRQLILTGPDTFERFGVTWQRSGEGEARTKGSRLLEAAHGDITDGEEQVLEKMTNNSSRAPWAIRFMDTKPRMLMEITNTAGKTLKAVEILTVFLKDEEGSAGPSRVHIRFDTIKSVQPNEKAVVSHRTWINGRPVSDAQDQIRRLEVVAGAVKPYVLDISWEDLDGKTQFQRIPVGH
jgi:hypothetical protein